MNGLRRLAACATVALAGFAPASTSAQDPVPAPDPAQAPVADVNLPARLGKQPSPEPIPEVSLVGNLETHPIRRGSVGPNWHVADASVLPLDREGIWVLEFSYRPVRMIEVDVPGKGRRMVHYLYYRVVNRTGKPRRFIPQFTLIDDKGKRYDDVVLPQAVKNIQAREDPRIDLLGAVNVMGMIPPSTKEGIDDAVYGVALWDAVDFRADSFKIFIRGLSDGSQTVTPPDGAKPFTRFKALRLDFNRPGDEHKPNEREIRMGDPPSDWTYF